MPTASLLVTAARYALGLAKSLELTEAADSELNRGVYSDALIQLATMHGLVVEEAGPLFEKALHELGVPLPFREDALRALLLHYIGAVAEGTVPPHAGLARLVDELYFPVIAQEPVSRYVGDSRGIESLLSYYWAYDDVRGRLTEVSVSGRYGEEAVAELDRLVVEAAWRWVRERAGISIDASWLGWKEGTPCRLARAINDERRFGDLPILADALEEAGCDNPVMLAHCREQASVHVRRCWVLDLLLMQ
jgi:hypothetical protein